MAGHFRSEELEGKGHSAADAACRLHQVYGVTIGTEDGDVTLGQKVAQINQRFHVERKAMYARQGLADKEVEERISLSG